MRHWLNQHQQAFRLVLHRLQQRWLGTLSICIVIGVTLAIPALLYMAVNQAQLAIRDVKQATQLSVFLVADIDQQQIEHLSKLFKGDSAILSVEFVPKAEALKQLTARTGHQELIATLDRNPLPDAFLLTPNALEEEAIQSLIARLQTQNGVEAVVADSAWIKRLNSLLNIGQIAVWIVGSLLGLAVIAIISNIIHMQVLMHKQEIEVSELFGATRRFIRRPFLYLGSVLGLLGGGVACLIMWGVTHALNRAIFALMAEYQTATTSLLIPSDVFPWVIVLGTSLGGVAAYVAVAFHPQRA